MLIEGQEYLVASYIVEGILDKRKEDASVMDKMIEITKSSIVYFNIYLLDIEYNNFHIFLKVYKYEAININ